MTKKNEHLETIKSHLKATDSPFLRKVLSNNLQSELLRDQIRACENCELHTTRTQAVPFTGPTHGRAKLVIVGEAPGAREDEQGKPFVGRSGRLLDECLSKAGISRSSVVILNSLCCRPPKNTDPTPNQLATCRPWFDKQLSMTRTWVGVALGGYALAAVMGVDRHSIRISDYLEHPVWVNGRVWFGTYHPSYVLRGAPAAKSEIIKSIRAALALKLGRGELPPYSEARTQNERQEEAITALSGADILGEGEKLAKQVVKKGWHLARSEVFGAHVLVVADEGVPYKPKFPDKLRSFPTYTVEELIRLGESAVRNGWGVTEMRRLHMVKVEFDGVVVA